MKIFVSPYGNQTYGVQNTDISLQVLVRMNNVVLVSQDFMGHSSEKTRPQKDICKRF